MINPKLINIESNRIEFVNEKDNRVGTDKLNGDVERSGWFLDSPSQSQMYKDGGRFPTQLFTNLTDEKYKYIKYVDTKN